MGSMTDAVSSRDDFGVIHGILTPQIQLNIECVFMKMVLGLFKNMVPRNHPNIQIIYNVWMHAIIVLTITMNINNVILSQSMTWWILNWINCNDFTATWLQIVLGKRDHLKMEEHFKLVTCPKLSRLCWDCAPLCTHYLGRGFAWSARKWIASSAGKWIAWNAEKWHAQTHKRYIAL